MTRKDLIDVAAGTGGITKAKADHILDALFDQMGKSLRSGESISIRGFGTFTPKDIPARPYRNPATGGTVDKPAKRAVKFKPSKNLL